MPHRQRAARSSISLGALFAASLVAAVDVFYLLTINAEDEGELGTSRVQFVAACIAAAAICCALGAVVRPGRLKLGLLAGAGFMLLLFTFIGLFSIGILLLVPMILALRAASQAAGHVASSQSLAITALVGAAALGVVALGLMNTS
jgi:hypothetical protein